MEQQMDKLWLEALVSLTAWLKRNQWKIATAESCTGGMVAEALTRLPGSSAWFERGFITYSNESKQQMLGVDPEVFRSQGAVSQVCVEQMARGALSHSNADVSIAVSGIAGPDGGSEEKPVGTVWLAWAQMKSGQVWVHSEVFLFEGDRQQIRQQATLAALKRGWVE